MSVTDTLVFCACIAVSGLEGCPVVSAGFHRQPPASSLGSRIEI